MNRIRFLAPILAAICLVGATTAARRYDIGTTITVNTTQATIANNGNCSLPEAVQAANTNLAVDACTAGVGIDTIRFIIGSGPQTITVTSPLHITAPAAIDGRTQPGYDPGTAIPVITVTSMLNDLFVIESTSPGSSVRGLILTVNAIAHADEAALRIEGNGNRVENNYINTDGTAATGGADAIGVLILGGDNNHIGDTDISDRNLFGGGRFGVVIEDGDGNSIRNNYFGLRADGVTRPTGFSSMFPAMAFCAGAPDVSACTNTTIRGNVVGGFGIGIHLGPASSLTTIAGNFIGVGADGTTKIGVTYGIQVNGSSDNTVGGIVAADRNVVSGNSTNIGLAEAYEVDPDDNIIQGNYIGTTADGLGRITPYGDTSSDYFGIFIEDGDGNLVGGTAAGSGNLISGNMTGLRIGAAAANTVVQGNFIGTDVTGAASLRQVFGIYLDSVASANLGDSLTPGNNLVSGNDMGINILESTGLTIYGNRIGLTAEGDLPLANEHGISLAGGSQASIARNWIAHNSVFGMHIDTTSTVATGSTHNCFTENYVAAYSDNSGASAALASNWWGSPTGPTSDSNPGGTGDDVGDNVIFAPFLTNPPPACSSTMADFNADGTTDVSVFRSGVWYVLNQGVTGYGQAGDIPIPADFNGDRRADIAVYRPSTGGWRVQDQFVVAYGGVAGDIPIPRDWDGDGDFDVAIYRSSTAGWYIKDQFLVGYGLPSDIPVPGDYNGDGVMDVAVFRDGVWYVRNQGVTGWGQVGDIPIPGDYDGDGDTDFAIYRPSTGGWRVKDQFVVAHGGLAGDIPVPGDYDADGDTDLAIYRSSTAGWYIKDQFTVGYGLPGDWPVPAPDTNGDGDPYQ